MFPSHLAERSKTLELAGADALGAGLAEAGAGDVLDARADGDRGSIPEGTCDGSRGHRGGIGRSAGHGQRTGPKLHGPDTTPGVLEQMVGEIDGVLEAIRQSEFGDLFDLSHRDQHVGRDGDAPQAVR